jgi:hypothetical protein
MGCSLSEHPQLPSRSWIDDRAIIRHPQYGSYTRQILVKHIQHANSNVLYRSLVWQLLRTSDELGALESPDILVEGLAKEIAASQIVWNEEQQINYSWLFVDNPSAWTPESPITPAWASRSEEFGLELVSRLTRFSRSRTLYPTVQRKKNVSRETARLFNEVGWETKGNDVTTCDLERLSYAQGVRVGGECEMRWAWKFNDLKPRCYYCGGGRVYWASRYMRDIAVLFMESSPYTNSRVRHDPTTMFDHLEAEDYVLTYDLTSFTTTLSELKFFLFWTAMYLKENIRMEQNPLLSFDYQDGFVELDIADLLLEYNEEVNISCPYSLHRIVDKLGIDREEPILLHMANSGPLGVGGNIGFSTTLHGVHLSPFCNLNKGVSVGDDVLVFLIFDPRGDDVLLRHISRIGNVNWSKTGTLEPMQEGEFGFTKFLKRRLSRDETGLRLDYLFDLPLFALAYGEVPDSRTIRPMERSDAVIRFIAQVNALFWDIHAHAELISDDEERILVSVLRDCFHDFGLPTHGAFPYFAASHPSTGPFEVPIAIAPVDSTFSPKRMDWSEEVWNRKPSRYFRINRRGDGEPVPPFSPGYNFVASSRRGLRVLEDIGVLRIIKREYEVVDSWAEDNLRLYLNSFARGSDTLATYQYLDVDPPEYFEELRFRMNRAELESVGPTFPQMDLVAPEM